VSTRWTQSFPRTGGALRADGRSIPLRVLVGGAFTCAGASRPLWGGTLGRADRIGAERLRRRVSAERPLESVAPCVRAACSRGAGLPPALKLGVSRGAGLQPRRNGELA
jgi:hypothetical protein